MRTKWRVAGLILALLLVVLTLPLLCAKSAQKANSYLVYVGTYTGPTSKGIYAFRFDESTGRATSLGVAAETPNPSFLAADAAGKILYVVNELSDYQGQKSGAVSAFSVDHASGKLTLLNQVSSHGAGPCYITLDKSGKYVLVANYDSGTVATFPILPDGKLGEAASMIQHSGHGSDPQRQEGPHAHEIELSRDNRFAVAADLGLDQLLVYKFDAANGKLQANNPAYAELDPGSGPRHFAFAPNAKFAYVLAEMKSTVTALSYDATAGTFHKVQTVSGLPPDFKGHNDAAEIAVSPSGKFVYASNRGSDTIAVFAIAPDGKLTPVEYAPAQGKIPRGFALDPTGSYLFVANQDSNNIVIFRVDAKSGKLSPTGQVLEAPTAVDVKFVNE
jgi:6-phosphogluconolactonase